MDTDVTSPEKKSTSGHWTRTQQQLLELLFMARRCSPVVVLAPVLTVGLVFLLQQSPWFSLVQKPFQEVLAPLTLALAAVLAGVALARHRHTYLKWQFLLVAALFCREMHFWGTNNGIYIVLIVMFWYAAANREKLAPFADSRRIMTLLFGAMLAYAVAKTFDRGYWRMLFPSVEPIRDAFEETIETCGHWMILAMVVVSLRMSATMLTVEPPGGIRPRTWSWTRLILLLLAPIVGFVGGVSLWKGKGPRAVRKPGELPYELSSVCPVDPALGEDLFLVGSDEFRTLSLCRITPGGRAILLKDLSLKIPQNDGLALQLDDLEGLAFDGRQTYYAVTSHRQLDSEADARRQRKSNATECAIVSFQLVRGDDGIRIGNARTVCSDLLERIRKLGVFPLVNWHHPKSFRWQHGRKSWQIDVEGLAVCDGQILLGFKNPVEEGRAAILRIHPATLQLSLVARPDFGGAGILSLDYDRNGDRLIVLTNHSLKGRYAESQMWIATRAARGGHWKFPHQPQLTLEDGTQTGRKASGSALHGGRLVVCFDHPLQPVIRTFPLKRKLPAEGASAADVPKRVAAAVP